MLDGHLHSNSCGRLARKEPQSELILEIPQAHQYYIPARTLSKSVAIQLGFKRALERYRDIGVRYNIRRFHPEAVDFLTNNLRRALICYHNIHARRPGYREVYRLSCSLIGQIDVTSREGASAEQQHRSSQPDRRSASADRNWHWSPQVLVSK